MNFESESSDELYREFFTPLFRYFLFRTSDKDIALDLTQTVFLKFLSHDYAGRDKDHNIRSLFTIARNSLIDHYRSRGKRYSLSLEDSEIDFPDGAMRPDEEFGVNADIVLVREAIAVLPHLDQDIVMLRLTTDMGYKEISGLVGEGEDSVRQKYSRALKKIKSYLESKKIYG